MDYRGNSEEIISLLFPGGLLEGEKPPPTLFKLADCVFSLERLARVANPDQSLKFGLVAARAGSLEIWLQIYSTVGSTIGSLADGPAAIRNLMLLLEELQVNRGRLGRPLMESGDWEGIAKTITDLRKSVRSAGSITIKHQSTEITFTDVDFRDADPAERKRRPDNRRRALKKGVGADGTNASSPKRIG